MPVTPRVPATVALLDAAIVVKLPDDAVVPPITALSIVPAFISAVVATKDENVPGYQNVLTQALGSKEKLKIQTKDFQLTSGDVVFLCTDGVYNEIGDEYLKNKLMDGVTAESLISEVLLQNPKDNISAIIINVI